MYAACVSKTHKLKFTMSVSASSYESILLLVQTFFDDRIPCYYTDQHTQISIEMIKTLLQEYEYDIVKTQCMMLEPITSKGRYIYISEPMVALLVNKTVQTPPTKIEFIKNFNIFDDLDVSLSIPDESQEKRIRTCMSSRYNGVERFSMRKHVQIVQLLRVAFMVAHFYQHFLSKIPYHSHEGWVEIECAKRTPGSEETEEEVTEAYEVAAAPPPPVLDVLPRHSYVEPFKKNFMEPTSKRRKKSKK